MPKTVPSQSITEPEASFQMPREFSNEVEVKDGDKRVVYVARAYNLKFDLHSDGLDIRGNLSLAKFEIETIETKEKRKQIWQFTDSNFCGSNHLISEGHPAQIRLLDLVLLPIYEKLMTAYRMARKFGGRQF